MRKSLSILLVCVLFMSMSIVPAHAALPEPDEPAASNYFTYYGTSMSRQGGGTLLLTFSTAGVGMCDVLGVADFDVQCWDADDEEWVNVVTNAPGETGTNVPSYTFSRYFYGTSGQTYRLVVTFVCTKYGMGTELKYYISPAIVA